MMKIVKVIFFISCVFMIACSKKTENTAKEEKTASPVKDTVVNARESEEKVILFFGNSLTAGYGLDPSESFPALIQQKIDSLGYGYKVVNAGLSGETTAGGKSRIGWVLRRQAVDIFVLELGANDGMRGVEVEDTKKNLIAIIEKVRNVNPDAKIILAGMKVPPNLGKEYGERFEKVYPEIAEEKNVTLIPFLLKNVAGEEELNLRDGIHPSEEGQKIVAENVWKVLKPVIEKQLK